MAKECSLLAVEIEINHDCNRSCAYCPNSILKRKHQGRMSEALFRRIMAELRSIDYRGRISFHFYNEPLLSPDLDRFTVLTKEYLPKCWLAIYTNGTLLTADRLRTLVALGVDKFIVTRHRGDENYEFARLFPDLEPALKNKVKFQGHQDLIFTNRGGLMKRVGTCKEPAPLTLPCMIPSSSAVITVNGNIVPCFEDYEEKNAMGNIREQSLLEIWKSPKYAEFRAGLKAGSRKAFPACRECNNNLVIP